MQLRHFCYGDETQMMRLMYNTVHSVNAADYTPGQLAAWCPAPLPPLAELEDRRRAFAQNITLLAVETQEDGGEALLGWAHMDKHGYLDHLFVHKDKQGQGVATALHSALVGIARAHGVKTMTTYSSITARPFFEKRGWHVVRPNLAEVRGQSLVNFLLEKAL